MVHVLQNDKFEMFGFDSQTSLIDFCDKNKFEFYRSDEHREWMGLDEEVEGWQTIEEKCQKRWEHGVDVFLSFIERLSKIEIPELKSRKRRTEYSSEGDDVDVERMTQGEEKYFKETKREQSTGSTELTIFIDTSTPFTVDSEDVLWRGAAALALAHILEKKGYTCEIWVVNGSTLYANKPGLPVYTACKLKGCGDPFDITTLVNVVSGWFYRSAIFTLIRTIGSMGNNTLKEDLGWAASPSQKELDCLSLDLNRIYISGVFSFSGACNLVESEVKKLAETENK